MCSGINELENELNKSQTLSNDLKSVNERKWRTKKYIIKELIKFTKGIMNQLAQKE